MKHVAVGILAHVDAGKTTLSEGLLFESGMIRNIGRVDTKNAFLDTDEQERARGITIFSKQAVIEYDDTVITLLDTPGHADFSAEMERTLWVMDYAILVISASDGVSGHTMTLWQLLKKHNIPTFIYVNKMDQTDASKEVLLARIADRLGDGLVDFTKALENDPLFIENAAMCDELIMEKYIDYGNVSDGDIKSLIAERKMFPCCFGSALKLDGVKEFLDIIVRYTGNGGLQDEDREKPFGARVFKIARDNKGERLTYVKITGGLLRVKDAVDIDGNEEKIDQIRIYSGDKYENAASAYSGKVCALTGLKGTRPGQGIGAEKINDLPSISPVLTYSVTAIDELSPAVLIGYLKELEEEEPELHVVWEEKTGSILVTLMGEVQIDVLKHIIRERFGIDVLFGTGSIVYKETILNKVIGVGHFEPLRHYAEVHLRMEPGERGSGLQFLADVSDDELNSNWQNLILTHLEEREHKGVLTGYPITDMCITLIAGRSHTKHTEGGDFRQATYRAVRQGLMEAENILLEPYYEFSMELPVMNVGRAMTDIEAMYGTANPPEIYDDTAKLTGTVPVSTMRDYLITFNSYTKGMGKLTYTFGGYDVCHNAEDIVDKIAYDPDSDIDNPGSSVFCSHGAGMIVPWYEVKEYAHVKPQDVTDSRVEDIYDAGRIGGGRGVVDYSIDEEQIEAIINKTSHANEKASKHAYKKTSPHIDTAYKGRERSNNGTRYLIVDGYNIVHAWDELKELIDDNLEGARIKLADILCNYQAFVKCEIILVFDAYKVKGNVGEFFDHHNIHVVYTKEAQTADAYIEQLTHKIAKEYQVTVATSDGLVQLITRGQNCRVISARELKAEIECANESIREYISGGHL